MNKYIPAKDVRVKEFWDNGDMTLDIQINEWLERYPENSILDIKYQVVPYVDGGDRSFILITYSEHNDKKTTGGEV